MTPPPDGSKAIAFLIKKGDLEKVEANPEGALRLFEQCGAHLRSAALIIEGDPAGSFQLSYDAARKSLTALLFIQGVRHTSKGGHIAIEQALTSQFPEVSAFARIRWMRPLRNQTEYPTADRPVASEQDAIQGLAAAIQILDSAKELAKTLKKFELG